MPAADAGRTHRLIVANVVDEGTVFVNGKRMGNVRGTNTPLVCDITPALKPGDNEIVIVIRDIFSIMDPEYVNEKSPVASTQYLDAPGGGSFGGSLGIGDIFIQTAPPLAAGDLVVVTSVRKGELAAQVLADESHARRADRCASRPASWTPTTPVMELGSREIALRPEQSESRRASPSPGRTPCCGARPARTCTRSPSRRPTPPAARSLDVLKERFGFRESWIDGDKIYFNGARVRLKGSTCQGGGHFQSDIQIQRGVNDLDFSDEAGFLCSTALAGVGNTPSKHNAERDVFWETARNNAVAGARLYGRHPSIIAWDLSNEWLSFLGYGSRKRRTGRPADGKHDRRRSPRSIPRAGPSTTATKTSSGCTTSSRRTTWWSPRTRTRCRVSELDGRHSMLLPRRRRSSAPWTRSSSPGRRSSSARIATRSGDTAARC